MDEDVRPLGRGSLKQMSQPASHSNKLVALASHTTAAGMVLPEKEFLKRGGSERLWRWEVRQGEGVLTARDEIVPLE